MSAVPFSKNRFLHAVIAGYALIWLLTAISPLDWPTWLIENLLVVIFVAVLVLTWRRFAFSNVSYLLIAAFLALHAIGAHTGYAQSPAGDWLRETFGLARNPYDRVIHCAFGLLLARPVHELMLRTGVRRGPAWWLPVCLITAVSSFFEVVEAIVAEMISPGSGPAWLGAQGDEWDAQYDMGVAMAGAAVAMLITFLRERATTGRPASP
jgi:putative membrane protein